jgi:hypothetical protein
MTQRPIDWKHSLLPVRDPAVATGPRRVDRVGRDQARHPNEESRGSEEFDEPYDYLCG